ncbi:MULTISPECIES: hypothetical protein [Olivibacter]|jgi:hypothetical protein|uniref:Uncharacterized protein n=2 Tax=Olivibacter TaxID=376469 RepID=A0ABV6HMK8_9SPHI|nr:hypothetical protein [Olivibacter jilunii]MCL4639862.1 hypothetical protein [Olivibacter sp. UJ_SKK_5.1]MDX3917385.1 hypothetical protein [Pseudosphingobacterium sp.]
MKRINENSTSGVIKMYSQGGPEVLVFLVCVLSSSNMVIVSPSATLMSLPLMMFWQKTMGPS